MDVDDRTLAFVARSMRGGPPSRDGRYLIFNRGRWGFAVWLSTIGHFVEDGVLIPTVAVDYWGDEPLDPSEVERTTIPAKRGG